MKKKDIHISNEKIEPKIVDIRLETEDQSLMPIGGATEVDGGMCRLRSLPIAAGSVLWSLPALVDDNEGPVE